MARTEVCGSTAAESSPVAAGLWQGGGSVGWVANQAPYLSGVMDHASVLAHGDFLPSAVSTLNASTGSSDREI